MRNGISYTLNGKRVELPAAWSGNRVRMLRVAIAKGATDIAVHTNGHVLAIDAAPAAG